jgi:hypothetical protein
METWKREQRGRSQILNSTSSGICPSLGLVPPSFSYVSCAIDLRPSTGPIECRAWSTSGTGFRFHVHEKRPNPQAVVSGPASRLPVGRPDSLLLALPRQAEDMDGNIQHQAKHSFVLKHSHFSVLPRILGIWLPREKTLDRDAATGGIGRAGKYGPFWTS